MPVKRALLLASAALITGGAALSFAANKAPHSAEQIAVLSDRLFEFGAVDFVHGAYTGPEQALFDCAARGRSLNKAQSDRYRTAYQAVLVERQSLFVRLDRDIQLRRDAGMDMPNNASGQGIAGLHDHHDASAADNLRNIARNLDALGNAGPLRRAVLANDIYKDLTDLMVHLAPAVHSVGLLPPDAVPAPLAQTYAPFYSAMKGAQRSAVNSAAYWQHIETALRAYAALAGDIQSRVRARNGALLHALSGRWLALQTIAPRLSAESPSAQARKKGGAPAPPCPA